MNKREIISSLNTIYSVFILLYVHILLSFSQQTCRILSKQNISCCIRYSCLAHIRADIFFSLLFSSLILPSLPTDRLQQSTPCLSSKPSCSRRSIWACPMTQYVTLCFCSRPTTLFFPFFPLILWYARVEKFTRQNSERGKERSVEDSERRRMNEREVKG